MKSSLPQHQKNRLLSLVIPLVALVLIFINPSDPRENSEGKLVNTATASIIPQNSTDSQLIIYNKVNDSLQKIINWKKHRLEATGSGTFVLFAGTSRIDECDSCIDINEKSIRNKYFISLTGFTLKQNASFRIEGNDYFIDRYIIEEKTLSGSMGHMEQKKIGVRLADPGHNQEGLTVLIPVSRSTFNVMEIIMYILFAIIAAAGLWIFIALPVKLLINIANGKAFVKQNIKYLNWIGCSLIAICLFLSIAPKLIQLALSSKMAGIEYPFLSSLFDHRWTIFLGIAILMMARAFKHGHQLQAEQDLTV